MDWGGMPLWKSVLWFVAIILGLCIFPIAFDVLWLSKSIYDRELVTSSEKNARGDEAKAEMRADETPYHIVISLRRFLWFSTTLLEAWSADFSVGMKWQDNDTLELQLDFGLESQTTTPVDHVGSIHVQYRFDGKGAIGDPTIEPFETCPPPYPSTFWRCEGVPDGAIKYGWPPQQPSP
jgi:hypothetical protein